MITEGRRKLFKLDLAADIELTGTPTTNRSFAPASSGDNTLVSAGATERLRVYKVLFMTSADMSGVVQLKLGSTNIGALYSPKAGGQYILLSTYPDYEYGVAGDDLVINLPSATTCAVNVSYEVMPV